MIDFDENDTYIEEGEFKNDQLNGTFGRRVSIKGKLRIGWFQDCGEKLHGYGQDTKTD